MTEPREAALQYARQHSTRFLSELKELASIPSVSTDPEHKPDMQKAANWLVEHLKALGVKNVQTIPTGGPDVVYGEVLDAGPSAPTVLVYGHYDVQPAEPLELWNSPAFEPTQRGDDIFARGISDMKGQVLVGMDAIESILRTGSLPVNVKFMIEGEEEVGSPHLDDFIAGHKDLLASDFCLNLDAGILGAETPSITYALRGLAYFELRLYGPAHDLHSGSFGGVVHNPAQVLCDLIAGMHDEKGRVTLPGFYDSVRPLGADERKELARLMMDEDFYLKNSGAPALFGEEGYTPVERTGARPTLEVNGLYSGFTGVGSKTVLPAEAMAKISTRLVPDQDPDEVHRQFIEYIEAHIPPTVRYEVEQMAGSPASISDLKMPGVVALGDALQQVWGKRPVFKREGGSVPVVILFQKLLGIDSVIGGYGLPDDNPHGPNEKLHLPTWYRGIETTIHFLFNLAGK
jgi:acetylornithine deacetylase/succinyl-diaminopimelate desuccinylase-like protein